VRDLVFVCWVEARELGVRGLDLGILVGCLSFFTFRWIHRVNKVMIGFVGVLVNYHR
jgi:hypothetical protein